MRIILAFWLCVVRDGRLIKFLIVLFAPLLLGSAIWQGSKTESLTVFPSSITGWTACASLDAYWPLDEISGTRSTANGSCTADCNLTAESDGEANAGEFCRAVKGVDTDDKFTCNSSTTCEELKMTSDFSITGWHRAAEHHVASSSSIAHLSGIFEGYAVFPYHLSSTNAVNFFINASPNIVDNAADTDVFTFFMASWDETADDSRICAAGPPIQDRSATWNACADNTSVSGPIGYGDDTEFAISRVGINNDPIYTDEIAIWDVLLTDPEWCFICSCRIDGTRCAHIGTAFRNTGLNESHCGGCTMPSVSSAGVVACPS